LQVTPTTAKDLKANYVPYVIVTDAKGVVQFSHVGAFSGIDTAKVRLLLASGGDAR
jgi:hypothetical protein